MADEGVAASHGSPGFDVESADVVRALWKGLNEASGAWIIVIRQDAVVTHANAAILAALGVTAEQAIGNHVSEILPKAIAAERMAYYHQVATTGIAMCLEGFVGGSLVRCSISPIPPAHPSGLPHTLCISRPIAMDESEPSTCTRTKTDDLGPLGRLSDREVEVLRLIGRGLTTAQIARELHRSVKTIEWHRVSLGSKLGASNRVELARWAIRFGLTSAFPPAAGSEAAIETDAPK